MSVAAVIVAAGRSDRLAGELPKQFREIAGKPLLAWTLSRFEAAKTIDTVVVVTSDEFLMHVQEHIIDRFGFEKATKIVSGGASRYDSVRLGLEALPKQTTLVAIHDAARPLVSPDDIDRVVMAASDSGAALLAVPVADTVKQGEAGNVVNTVSRAGLFLAQTPQVFPYAKILSLHGAYKQQMEGTEITDDVALAEGNGLPVRIVEPNGPNFKLTTPRDLIVIEAILEREAHG